MIIQPTFHIPPEIEKGLVSGDFIRHGGVVRDTAGRLVTYLQETLSSEKVMEKAVNRTALSLKNPWTIVGLGTGGLIAAAGAVVVVSRKRKNDAELDIPKCVQKYQLSLEAYLDAIQTGSLEPDNIDRLVTDLDAVIAYAQENDTTVGFSPDQLAKITKIVFEYTSELAKANPVELHETEYLSETTDDDVVIDLRRNLETQKRIFDKAA